MSQTIADGAGWSATQTYGYDMVNRLKTAQESAGGTAAWKITSNYDQWGNRWVSDPASDPTATFGVTLNPFTPTVATKFNAKNQMMVTGAASDYDAAGNQLAGYSLAYDAENRVVSAAANSNGTATYAYDGDGRRVTKSVNPGSAV